jgi:hypothetical protein
MRGFQIPLELKIDFLENVVLPSFGVSLENGEPRNNWMRMRADGKYQPHLEDLILAFNWMNRGEQVREERQFLLQQQQLQGKFLSVSFILTSHFFFCQMLERRCFSKRNL